MSTLVLIHDFVSFSKVLKQWLWGLLEMGIAKQPSFQDLGVAETLQTAG
jgi:hypothetical protein